MDNPIPKPKLPSFLVVKFGVKIVLMVGGALHCLAMRGVVLKHPKQVLNNVFGLEGARFLIQNGPMLFDRVDEREAIGGQLYVPTTWLNQFFS